MAKTKTPRNYRATEATLINVRAAKKKMATLAARIARLEARLDALEPHAPPEPEGPTTFDTVINSDG